MRKWALWRHPRAAEPHDSLELSCSDGGSSPPTAAPWGPAVRWGCRCVWPPQGPLEKRTRKEPPLREAALNGFPQMKGPGYLSFP